MTKTFKGGMDSLLTKTKSKASGERGRPKTNYREVTKTSQIGTKENETRATFIMNETQLEAIKALAYWDRVTIKDVLAQALDNYLARKKNDLGKALTAYKGKGKG